MKKSIISLFLALIISAVTFGQLTGTKTIRVTIPALQQPSQR